MSSLTTFSADGPWAKKFIDPKHRLKFPKESSVRFPRSNRPNTSARITFDFTPKTWVVRRGKLFLPRRRSFFANHSQFDLSPIKSYSPISVPRCDPRARPVVTARELKPTIWIDKVFFPRSVRGNYWSPGREEQNAGLISKIGRAVWEIRGPIDFGSYGAPNRP